MFFAIICVIALFGAQSWAGTARDITRADAIYQEKLQKYLETVPKEVADEALMTVVSNKKLIIYQELNLLV